MDEPTTDETGFDATAFAREIAAAVGDFLDAVQSISRANNPGAAVPLLLIEVSQILFAGARLGAQRDFDPVARYQPDVGPDPDLDELRLRLAGIFGGADGYLYIFDPYGGEPVEGAVSDDLASIAGELDTGLRHYADGNPAEALWWWQFSYVSSWGATASAVLRALQSIVAHDRLDHDVEGETEQLAAAAAVLDDAEPVA